MMNERIRELIQDQNGHRGLLWTEEDKEEFAELIVRECRRDSGEGRGMNRDDIIRMAKEAGYEPLVPRTFADDLQEIFIRKFAALVAAAEREACAKVCEETRFPDSYTAIRCATAIRARGEQEQPR